MKINSKKTSKKPFIITAIIAALLVAVAVTYVYAFNGSLFGWNNNRDSSPSNKPSTNLDKPTDEQIEAGNDIKKGNTDTPPAPAEQPGSSKKNVGVIITAANQNNDLLQIRAEISTVINTGQCILNLTKSGKTVTKTADVQALASTSTCKGFDIPVSELSSGLWQATLTYENETLAGTASKVITIQ